MTAPAITPRAKFTVTNPTAEPTDAWIRAVAVMLLAAADRKLAERADHARALARQAGLQ
jgi:hypothetical protein